MNFIPLLGYKIADLPMEKILKKINNWLPENKFRYLVTLNPEILIKARKHKEIKKILKNADLCVADGTGLIQASRLINKQKPAKITGADLTIELLKQGEYSFYLLGAKEKIINKAVENIQKKYPKAQITGYNHGYLTEELELKVISEIIRNKPQIILVGMGFPRQELFINKLKTVLNSGLAIGVGGMIEVLSGEKHRAPKWTQSLGIEWLYRGLTDPKRIIRWSFMPLFILLVIKILLNQEKK